MTNADQPTFISELVDWLRSCGFELISTGKEMNFEPRYRYSTSDTVWDFSDGLTKQLLPATIT